MAHRQILLLTDTQRAELQRAMLAHPKAYMRERSAALLKIAAGQSPHAVAHHGLLHVRDPDTVYGWLARYRANGFAGLLITAGRGRKPTFFPSHAGPGARGVAPYRPTRPANAG